MEERKKATLDEFPAPFVSLAKQQAPGETKKSFVSFSMFAAGRRNSIDLQCNFLEEGSFHSRNMRLKTSDLASN